VKRLLILVLACGKDPSPKHELRTGDLDSGPERRDVPRLAAYLREVVAMTPDARRKEVDGWKLDDATFRKSVLPTYAKLYPDYARRFDDAEPALLAVLDKGGDVVTRAHYAGDTKLTHTQARLRWPLPIEYPTAVATIGGAVLDTVFVPHGKAWGVLAGVDEAQRARVEAMDASCAARLEPAGVPGRCNDVGWAVVDAMLRDDAPGFAHACQLAATLCATR